MDLDNEQQKIDMTGDSELENQVEELQMMEEEEEYIDDTDIEECKYNLQQAIIVGM